MLAEATRRNHLLAQCDALKPTSDRLRPKQPGDGLFPLPAGKFRLEGSVEASELLKALVLCPRPTGFRVHRVLFRALEV